jgi:hypothetical protein
MVQLSFAQNHRQYQKLIFARKKEKNPLFKFSPLLV